MNLLIRLALSIAVTLVSTQVSAQNFMQLGYESQPRYLPSNKIVSLTFDDGVDVVNTPKILDVLRNKGIKATFFINANNISKEWDPGVADLINRIVNEGHGLANHTDHHYSLPSLSDADINSEIVAVEDYVKAVTNGRISRLTLLRAPFGEGFQNGVDQRVANIVARYAVQIGWNFDTFDYNCEESDRGAQCVYDGFFGPLNQGAYGIVLMHSIHPQTAAALPRIIDELKQRNYSFWSVEQMVQARYGKTSNELLTAGSNGFCAGVPDWNPQAYYKIGDKVVLDGQLFVNQNQDSYPGIEPNVSTWFWAAGSRCN